MPTPRSDETWKEFKKRCMAFEDMQKYERDKRYAICLSYWKRNKNKEDD